MQALCGALVVAALNVPAAQGEQTWLLVAVPAVETYVPTGHVVYAVHAAKVSVLAPAATELNVPVGQATQVGGTDVLATGLEYCPEAQCVG
jgi:hypothetical protein